MGHLEKVAYLCNNYFHVLISYLINKKLDIEGDLILLGRNDELSKFELSHRDYWSNVYEHFYDQDLDKIFFEDKSNIKKFKSSIRTGYESLVYYVDKDPLNQLYLKYNTQSNKILIEEGIGLYNNKNHSIVERLKRKIVYLFKYKELLNVKKREQGGAQYHDFIFSRNIDLLPKIKYGNIDTFQFDYIDFSDIQISVDQNTEDLLGEKFLLYIGSDFSGNNWISPKQEESIIVSLKNCALDNGLKFYVKPHPREDLNKYKINNIDVINSYFPSEITSLSAKPTFVATIMSSTLLNISGHFPSIFLYNLIANEFPNKETLSQLNSSENPGIIAPEGFEDVSEFMQKDLGFKNDSGFGKELIREVSSLIKEL